MAETGPAIDDVFGLVANETRIDILRTLWDEHTVDEHLSPDPVPFSALRERVGVRDSGRFNYHLDELVPEFVRHHEEGYTLTYAGSQVVGATVSGVYTDADATLDAIPVDACPDEACDGRMEATYEKGHVVVACDTCDVRNTISAPPILVEAHDPAENPSVLREFTLTQLQRLARGFCPLCSGPVTTAIADEYDAASDDADRIQLVHECEACGGKSHTNVTSMLVDHPAVVATLHDAGVDYRDLSLTGTGSPVDVTERVRREDPLRIEVSVAAGDEHLTVTLDESFSVVDYTRE